MIDGRDDQLQRGSICGKVPGALADDAVALCEQPLAGQRRSDAWINNGPQLVPVWRLTESGKFFNRRQARRAAFVALSGLELPPITGGVDRRSFEPGFLSGPVDIVPAQPRR